MVKKIAENFNRLSRAHQRHRQTDDRHTTDRQTDGSAIAYSERERDFTSAKNSGNRPREESIQLRKLRLGLGVKVSAPAAW